MQESTHGDVVASTPHRLLAGLTVILVFAGAWLGFRAVWERDPFSDLGLPPGGWIGAAVIVLASGVIHESIHALVWRGLGGAGPGSVSVRRTWRVMGFEAHVVKPLPIRAYRWGLVSPALVLVAAPLAVAIAAGRGAFIPWAGFFLVESHSDLVALFALRRVRPGVAVRSHASRIGCAIAPAGDGSTRAGSPDGGTSPSPSSQDAASRS